jgi:hypothetical protein
MPKRIVSMTLSERNVEKVDKVSKALGMSRSELMDFLIEKGFRFPQEMEANIEKITKLQEEAKGRIQEGSG